MLFPISIQTAEGATRIDVAAIYDKAKAQFLADYADDSAVAPRIRRDGDLAEREVKETLAHLSPERCALASRAEIESSVRTVARLAFCNLALGYRALKTKKR